MFNWLARMGKVDALEMLRVFNCGVGMALVVSDPDAAIRVLQGQGEIIYRIGVIEASDGPAHVRFEPPSGWLA